MSVKPIPITDIPLPDRFPLRSDVEGKSVVVTGAGRGLGRLLAVAFARSGATVGLVSRNEEQLTELARSLPGEHFVFAGDVRDAAFNMKVCETMDRDCGGLDVFIANAGVSPVLTKVEKMSPESWDSIISTNLTGAFLGARAAASAMRREGRIILTSSVIGQRSMVGLGAYAASKAGMDALVRTMALELGPRAITVNGVAPGWFDSPLSAGFRGNDELEESILSHSALGRWGLAEDLPGIFLFLASEAAQFITGTVIPVDGGYLLQ